MKRTTKKDNKEEYNDLLHELLATAEDHIEKHELESYIRSDNTPREQALEEDQNVTVTDVLMLGSIMTLRKLHHALHEDDTSISITTNIPPEILSLLREALGGVDDKPKGKKEKK